MSERRVLMVCLGFADGDACDSIGHYLQDYDPDYQDGLGRAWWTKDADMAMVFPDNAALFEFWKKVSKVRPLRADGKPNRPLTAFSITHADYDDLHSESLDAMVQAAKATQRRR